MTVVHLDIPPGRPWDEKRTIRKKDKNQRELNKNIIKGEYKRNDGDKKNERVE